VSKLDDITEKIESLLSDEESMNQIKELAAMLSGGMNGADPQPGNNAADFSASGNADNPGNTGDTGGNIFGGINPIAIMQLLGAASSDDKDCGLLLALRPHLSAEKQKRLDKAVKLLKLYNIFTAMRDNGILNDLENML
jgi:hypothetical protein